MSHFFKMRWDCYIYYQKKSLHINQSFFLNIYLHILRQVLLTPDWIPGVC